MSTEETAKLLSVLKTAYPHSFSNLSPEDAKKQLELWATMFADDSVALVAAAIKYIIATDPREFAPPIALVKAAMDKIANGANEMTEAEAWGLIHKAIGNGLYGAEEEFKQLPPTLQKLVGSPGQLRDWAMADADVVNTVIASNVQRAFRAIQAREKEMRTIPADVRMAIEGLANQMSFNNANSITESLKTQELKPLKRLKQTQIGGNATNENEDLHAEKDAAEAAASALENEILELKRQLAEMQPRQAAMTEETAEEDSATVKESSDD